MTRQPFVAGLIYICHLCHLNVAEEDVVWIDPASGEASTSDKGRPYHVGCAPAQHE